MDIINKIPTHSIHNFERLVKEYYLSAFHHSPSRLVKEHNGRVVDKFESDRESLALTSRQIHSASILHFDQAKCIQDVIDLRQFNPFVLPNLEPKCAPGDPILYPESIFCYSP